jgi:hypothetical protein
MKTKRFFFGLPVVSLAMGLVVAASLTLAGCGGGGDGDGDGGVQLPANLQNTKWEGGYQTLTFGTTTVTRSSDGTVYTVASAAENGAIVLNASGRSGTKPLCDSYTVSATTLILTGGDFSGTYTKVTTP